MKKILAGFFLLLSAIVFTAVMYSPLGGGTVYKNNAPIAEAGIVYPATACVRYDFDGEIGHMYDFLSDIDAEVKKTVKFGDLTIAYAHSDRVASNGDDGINVMAAYRNGHIAIGAPILEGSY